jgi:hypothetical protein
MYCWAITLTGSRLPINGVDYGVARPLQHVGRERAGIGFDDKSREAFGKPGGSGRIVRHGGVTLIKRNENLRSRILGRRSAAAQSRNRRRRQRRGFPAILWAECTLCTGTP